MNTFEEQKELQRALRLQESRLETLVSLSRMDGDTTEQIADFVLEEQIKITGSQMGWLGFVSEDQLHIAFHERDMGAMEKDCAYGRQMRLSVEMGGIWGDAVKERKTVVINDSSKIDPRNFGFPGDYVSYRRLLVTPVFEQDRIRAVAMVANKHEQYDATDVKYHTLLLDGMWKLISREQLRKTLAHTESLAAVGRALSYVAHDMRTPLTAIGGFASLVRKRMGETNPDRSKLEIVIRETRRLENMIKNMLDFSRPIDIDKSPADIDEMVSESLSLLDSEAKERELRLMSTIEPDLPRASLDLFRMKQALVNLAANAIQSSPEGGTVSIDVYTRQDDLIFDIVDNGPGIFPEKRKSIFKPFFTTKKGGTGLGLSIVQRIVEAHKGWITILDNTDRGLTFRVEIPDCLDRG
ncbi:MAG: ATP-binding protein [Syntrophobacteraceae bacterium]|nr:ATP-binding protein [Syntrophobacteraceae bacterium]